MIDDFDIIETPENVNLQRRLAGIGSRFLAGLLDTLLIVGLYAVLFLAFVAFGSNPLRVRPSLVDTASTVIFAILILFAFLIYWGYFVLFEARLNGQTPGKKYMKIRVVQQEGAAATLDSIAVRNLLRVVDFIGLYAVAGIVMFVTKKSQRLGDLAAGTVVISEEIQDYAAKSDKKRKLFHEVSPAAACLAATGLKTEEYQLLHNYWLRRHELSLEARERLLPELIRPILNRMGVMPANQSLLVLEQHVEDLLTQARGTDTGMASSKPVAEARE
jgi:uncharacterized RDD family membrane protein YckC